MTGLQRIVAAAGAGGEAPAQAQAIAAACGAHLHAAAGAVEACPAAARDCGADLLVIVPPRDPHSGRLALEAAHWQALRDSPCPVLLAGAGPARPYRSVVVAVDPMHEHDKPAALDDALVVAAMAVAGPAARIGLLHCYLPPEYVPLRAPGATRPAVLNRREGTLEAHRAALAALAGRHGIGPGRTWLEPGDPREAIPEIAAREAADLVVLGAVARGRLRRLLIGSTTEPVLGRLACDVLTVGLPAGI